MIQLGVMTHYMEGATYPVGGAGQIPRKMNAVIAAGGGCTFVKARVTELIYADGAAEVVGVIVNNEIEIRTRNVISSIGVGRTYRDLIATQFPSLAEGPLSRIYAPEMKYSAAFIFLFLSLDISKMSEADRKKYEKPRHFETQLSTDECTPTGTIRGTIRGFILTRSAGLLRWRSDCSGNSDRMNLHGIDLSRVLLPVALPRIAVMSFRSQTRRLLLYFRSARGRGLKSGLVSHTKSESVSQVTRCSRRMPKKHC